MLVTKVRLTNVYQVLKTGGRIQTPYSRFFAWEEVTVSEMYTF